MLALFSDPQLRLVEATCDLAQREWWIAPALLEGLLIALDASEYFKRETARYDAALTLCTAMQRLGTRSPSSLDRFIDLAPVCRLAAADTLARFALGRPDSQSIISASRK